jgi:hypothetical protein
MDRVACLCHVSFKGTDETPLLGLKPACLACAPQRMLAMWHILFQSFAAVTVNGQGVGKAITLIEQRKADLEKAKRNVACSLNHNVVQHAGAGAAWVVWACACLFA